MIQRVKEILDRHGVQYAVIGAMAMTARGHARFTLDFDFLTTDKAVLDPQMWEELVRDGIPVDVRRGEFDDPAEVDVVVGKWK